MARSYLGLTGGKLQIAISVIAGMDFLLFGYDQGVTGGLLTLQSFIKYFPTIATNGEYYESLTKAQQSTQSTRQGKCTILCYALIIDSARGLIFVFVKVSLSLRTTWAALLDRFPQFGLATCSVGAKLSSLVRLLCASELCCNALPTNSGNSLLDAWLLVSVGATTPYVQLVSYATYAILIIYFVGRKRHEHLYRAHLAVRVL